MKELQILSILSFCVVAFARRGYYPGDSISAGQGSSYGSQPSYNSPSYERSSYYGNQDSYSGTNKDSYYRTDTNQVYKEGFKGGRYYFGGHFKDKCYQDGLYFLDENRFVFCSNGNPYIQPCAPGTRNSGDGSYKPGYYYGYSDFCNLNLVDYGYGPEAYQPYAHDGGKQESGYKNGGYSSESSSYDGYSDTKRTYPASSKDSYGSDNYGAQSAVQDHSRGYSSSMDTAYPSGH